MLFLKANLRMTMQIFKNRAHLAGFLLNKRYDGHDFIPV
jgi:hypothetical protein